MKKNHLFAKLHMGGGKAFSHCCNSFVPLCRFWHSRGADRLCAT